MSDKVNNKTKPALPKERKVMTIKTVARTGGEFFSLNARLTFKTPSSSNKGSSCGLGMSNFSVLYKVLTSTSGACPTLFDTKGILRLIARETLTKTRSETSDGESPSVVIGGIWLCGV